MMRLSFDINAEHALAQPLRPSDRAAFLAEGVPQRALSWSTFNALSILAIDRVVFGPGGRFEFQRYIKGENIDPPCEMQNAYVLPLLNQLGDVDDILAFRPGGPAATWLGRAPLAGAEQVNAPRCGEPLTVQETVLAWLQAGRHGIVVVDYSKAADLLNGHILETSSPEHARRLRIALARPAPPVVVRDGGRAA